ncbi:hypothetical protein GGR57DRAFT_463860 [Xylariaceae sp. FL1272]|nr:hypothetical protein GGR57DRAFT_463860 [Xylariaceae sp. FL1272]
MKALRAIPQTTIPRRLRPSTTTLPSFNITTPQPLPGRYGHPNSDSAVKRNKTMEPHDLPKGSILALPESSSNGDTTELAVGSSVRFDGLGPVVVNVDGSLSRIANWDKMSAIEKDNTYRIIGKRNAARRAALLSRQEEEQQQNLAEAHISEQSPTKDSQPTQEPPTHT